jgi:hypothetical protein
MPGLVGFDMVGSVEPAVMESVEEEKSRRAIQSAIVDFGAKSWKSARPLKANPGAHLRFF